MEPTYILRGIGGSHAHGLATEKSDEDLVGVFSWPTSAFWTLNEPKDSIVQHEPQDAAYHEVRKFCSLASKANPTVLESIHLDSYLEREPTWGNYLIEIRSAFYSERHVMNAFIGYSESQFRKWSEKAKQYEDVSSVQSDAPGGRFRPSDARAGRTGETVQGVRESTTAPVSSSTQGQKNGGGLGVVSASQKGSLGSKEVGHLTSNVRDDGGNPKQSVQNLPGADGRPGSRSRDGRVEGDALPQVQSGNGTFQRQLGADAEGGELPAGSLRPRERKAAIHALRLMEQGHQLYTTGEMHARVADPDQYREWQTWNTDRLQEEWVKQWGEFIGAKSVLPAEPDYAKINGYLYDYRKAH